MLSSFSESTMVRRPRFLSLAVFLLLALGISPLRGQSTSTMTVGSPTVDANGVKYYPVTSVYQGSQPQTIRVLQPTNPPPGVPPRVLFVLPVDAGVDTASSTWGDGLDQLRQLDVPNTYNMTLIEPSFNYEPWFGDDVLDPTHRMESFIIDDLVPFGDTFLPTSSVPQRYLIGFSKSGNAVLFFMLRHPGVFNAGAAWDSPAQLSLLTGFSALPENFGTQANFATYNIPALVSSNAQPFQSQNRLWISGDQAAWTADMDQLNDQMNTAGIEHTWITGATRVHEWNSGWLPGAVSDLAANATLTAPDNGNIPPALTGGLPAGILAKGTSQASLSVITDENATCRYATTAGVAYASMTNTFSNTGGTAHSTSVTGLGNGESYNYYVRCEDSDSNVDASDYVISFSVDTTAIALSNSGNITANAGATTGNSTTITVTPSGNFTGAVTLSCQVTTEISNPSNPAACVLTSTSVNITGTAPVDDTLSIVTNNGTSAGVYTATVSGTDAATGKITGSTGLAATINPAGSPTIALTNSGNVSVNAGATTGNTSTVTITPSDGFTGAVNLSCAVTSSISNPASPATCSLARNSVNISGTTAADTVTVKTTGSTTPGVYTVTIGGSDAATAMITGSTSLTATVNPLSSTPSIALTNSGNIVANAGATSGNTSTITVTPSGGFTGAVNLSCAVTTSIGSPTSPATCSLSSSSASITGTTPATDTVTVKTTASTSAGVYTVTVNGSDAATGKITGSTSLTATVNPLSSTPSIALTNSGNITANAGATSGNTSTITVTPSGGFTGAVNLSCAVTTSITNPTSPATCSLSSSSASISGTTAATDTVTVKTTASTSAGVYTVTVNGSDAATGKITGSTSLTATINSSSSTPSFALTNSGNITVNPGATTANSSTITVTPSGGFTGGVKLTCSVTTTVTNPADTPTCTFSANSLTISGSTAQTSTLTVNTTGSSAALYLPLTKFFAPVGGTALAMVLFFGIPARRRAWRTLFSLLAVVVVMGSIGCGGGGAYSGGGGGGGGGTGGGGTGTTAGSYTVTVTGTDAASGTITATSAVALTVN